MPKIDKIFSLEITPEQFLNNCSDLELQELDILIQNPRFANRINSKDQIKNLNKIKALHCCECNMISAFTEYPDHLSCKVCGTKRGKP